jgi:hypothetical protein
MDLGQRTASVKVLIRVVRTVSFGTVIANQGPRGPVHRFFRRRIHRGRHQDSRQPPASAQGERHLRKNHRHPAARTLRPAADRQRAPSTPGTDRVPAALQRCPAPRPRPAATCSSTQPATADRPSRASGPSKAGPWRPHARVPDRRLTSPGPLRISAGNSRIRVFEPHKVTAGRTGSAQKAPRSAGRTPGRAPSRGKSLTSIARALGVSWASVLPRRSRADAQGGGWASGCPAAPASVFRHGISNDR